MDFLFFFACFLQRLSHIVNIVVASSFVCERDAATGYDCLTSHSARSLCAPLSLSLSAA